MSSPQNIIPGLNNASGVIASGKMIDIGLTTPTDGTAGYGRNCLFLNFSSGQTGGFFLNEGSETSCDFNSIVSVSTSATMTGKTLTSPTINGTVAGSPTFSGAVVFTGTQIESAILTPTSAAHTSRHRYTLAASRDAGKTIVFTSGNNTSRHTWVMLPFASTLTGGGSGMIVRLINSRVVNSSKGLTIVTSAAAGRTLNGSSRTLRSTSRIVNGSITLAVANKKWWVLSRDVGSNGSVLALNSLVWLSV